MSTIIVQRHDSYEAVFSDIFFYISALLGTLLMLLVERADPKTKFKFNLRRIVYSIVACFSVVFVAGTVRASMIDNDSFSRNHWFYAIVMFLCAIAPELIRLIILKSPKSISDGFNRGIERRIETFIGGDNNDNSDMVEPTKFEGDE